MHQIVAFYNITNFTAIFHVIIIDIHEQINKVTNNTFTIFLFLIFKILELYKISITEKVIELVYIINGIIIYTPNSTEILKKWIN